MKSQPPQRTPAKTAGQAKPAPRRRGHGGAPAGKPGDEADAVMAQAKGTQALVTSMPYNANKELDFRRDSALNPPPGLTAEAASDAVSASTLSELNVSAKTGAPAPPGGHAADGRLAQARVDGSRQVLTTNQGVAMADNQARPAR